MNSTANNLKAREDEVEYNLAEFRRAWRATILEAQWAKRRARPYLWGAAAVFAVYIALRIGRRIQGA